MVKNKVELPQEGLPARSKRCCVYWKCICSFCKRWLFFTDKIDHLTRKFQVFNKNIKAKTSHYKMIGVKNGKNGTAIQLEISAEKSGYHLRTSDLIKKIPLLYLK